MFCEKKVFVYNVKNFYKNMTKNLPKKFISRLGEMYDSQKAQKILENFAEKRVGSFRINLLKSSLQEVKKEFDEK